MAVFILFCSHVSDAYAQDIFFLSFGNGKKEVKLYTDYFCGPCSKVEPQIEPLLIDLVKREVATVTFVDVPFHKHSPLYARYFLYIINFKKDLGQVLKAREALFSAAKENITNEEDLEAYLQKRLIRFKPFDVKPVFMMLQTYMKSDQIRSTPTCVITTDKKEYFTGSENIVKALESLR